MRTIAATFSLIIGLVATACGGHEPLPPMPEPAEPADTSGGDLDSLMEEEEPPPPADEN